MRVVPWPMVSLGVYSTVYRFVYSAVGGRLDAVQLRIGAALRHQVLVGADLGHAGAVEHDDEVGHAHRAEAVRHQDRDASHSPAVAGGGGCARRRRVALEEGMFGL